MMTSIFKHTSACRPLWALLALMAASCGSDDSKMTDLPGEGGEDGPATVQTLQLSPAGHTSVSVEGTDNTYSYALAVERQGTDASARLSATLTPWTEEEMKSYNAGRGTSYAQLPAALYTLTPAAPVLEEGAGQTEVSLSLDPSAVLEEMRRTRSDYAVGLTLTSEDARIANGKGDVVVALSVNCPRLAFDIPSEEHSVSLRKAVTEVQIPTRFTYRQNGADAGSPADFTCPLTVPGNAAELVAEYNTRRGTSHVLLPSVNCDLGEGVHYSAGDREASATLTVALDGLGVESYLLPLTLGEPSDGSVLPSADIYYVSFRQTYSNPVLDNNCPDPTVLRAQDGNFYLYCTEGTAPPTCWSGNTCRG